MSLTFAIFSEVNIHFCLSRVEKFVSEKSSLDGFDRLKMNNHFSRVAGVVVISLITARTPIPSLKEKKTWARRTGVKKLARLRPVW